MTRRITIGRSTTVHAAYERDGSIRKVCGFWANTAGSGTPIVHNTDAAVTCKACLKSGKLA